MLPPKSPRFFIDSEARLSLPATCRGGEGAGLGSGAVRCSVGRCGEGRASAEGREGGEARTEMYLPT